ncbi:MAG: response regulator [Actinomycetota bacterium]|nr:response regulator [Actinomycetota bacterium]
MGTKRILIADDNRFIRTLVRAALSSLGHEIIEAVDGQEACDLAFSCEPNLIILDVVMPHMSGFEVLERIRTTDGAPTCPIAMLTTAATPGDHKHADEFGAEGYITKPFDNAELRQKVTELLED